MSKKLNEDALQSELSEGSAFFAAPNLRDARSEDAKALARAPAKGYPGLKQTTNLSVVTPRNHEATNPSRSDEEHIETIRRAVNHFGKEDATYRFTSEEKKALADIVYTYSVAGIRTSQNEITRIAVNNLLEDYRENGQASVLVRVLERLNA